VSHAVLQTLIILFSTFITNYDNSKKKKNLKEKRGRWKLLSQRVIFRSGMKGDCYSLQKECKWDCGWTPNPLLPPSSLLFTMPFKLFHHSFVDLSLFPIHFMFLFIPITVFLFFLSLCMLSSPFTAFALLSYPYSAFYNSPHTIGYNQICIYFLSTTPDSFTLHRTQDLRRFKYFFFLSTFEATKIWWSTCFKVNNISDTWWLTMILALDLESKHISYFIWCILK